MPRPKHRRRQEPSDRSRLAKRTHRRKERPVAVRSGKGRHTGSRSRRKQHGQSMRARGEPTIRVHSDNPMVPGQVGQPDRVKKIVFKQLGPYLRTLTDVMHMDPKKNEEKIRKKLLDLGKPRKVNGKTQFHEDDIGSSMEISVLLG